MTCSFLEVLPSLAQCCDEFRLVQLTRLDRVDQRAERLTQVLCHALCGCATLCQLRGQLVQLDGVLQPCFVRVVASLSLRLVQLSLLRIVVRSLLSTLLHVSFAGFALAAHIRVNPVLVAVLHGKRIA